MKRQAPKQYDLNAPDFMPEATREQRRAAARTVALVADRLNARDDLREVLQMLGVDR